MWWRVVLIALFFGAVSLATGVAMWSSASGIRVAVTNDGLESLRDVVVHVTGVDYSLGDLGATESRTVVVCPQSDSHVEIEFTHTTGRRIRLNAGATSGQAGKAKSPSGWRRERSLGSSTKPGYQTIEEESRAKHFRPVFVR